MRWCWWCWWFLSLLFIILLHSLANPRRVIWYVKSLLQIFKFHIIMVIVAKVLGSFCLHTHLKPRSSPGLKIHHTQESHQCNESQAGNWNFVTSFTDRTVKAGLSSWVSGQHPPTHCCTIIEGVDLVSIWRRGY